MIKIEKRLMEYCENCDDLQACTTKLRTKNDNDEYDIKVVVMCQHADICSHAVHQYQKTCENTPIISDPSPCKYCKFMDKECCCGCKEYFEWRKKYDD